MINQTGGPSFLRNIGITAGESTIAFDIGLIKPLWGRHQSAVAWRDCRETLRWEARIHRGTPTILFIPRNEIHCVWKMSDMTRHAGVSGAQISEDQGRQKTKDIIHPGDVLTLLCGQSIIRQIWTINRKLLTFIKRFLYYSMSCISSLHYLLSRGSLSNYAKWLLCNSLIINVKNKPQK